MSEWNQETQSRSTQMVALSFLYVSITCFNVSVNEKHSGKSTLVEFFKSESFDCHKEPSRFIQVGLKCEEVKKLMGDFKQWPCCLVYVSNSCVLLNHCEPIHYCNYICHFVCIYNVRNGVFNLTSK